MTQTDKLFSKKNILRGVKTYTWIIIGSFLTGAAINVFMVPYKIAPGGVSGIATVLFYITGGKLSVGVSMLALNIPLFIAGIRYIGKGFAVRTLFSTILLSVIIDTTVDISKYFVENFLVKLEPAPSAPDLLLYSIFGGFLMGVGLGVVFKSGATTGGTDLAARIVHHFIPAFTIGQILLFIDTSVIILASVAFKSFILGLYAIVTLFVSSKVIDAILEGVNFAKAVFIISDHSDEIASRILVDLDRGVTALNGTGMYTGDDKKVLLCVLHRGQIPKLKEIVRSVDEKSFIILTDIREVLGEGFKTYEN
ncbi:MAG: YitT family protein [Clostridia bacterium]|nr:YitT family protein [Clostridia bacterium]